MGVRWRSAGGAEIEVGQSRPQVAAVGSWLISGVTGVIWGMTYSFQTAGGDCKAAVKDILLVES